MIADFDTSKWKHGELIIYGAGENGCQIARGLLAMGIRSFFFCDQRLSGKMTMGKETIAPQSLLNHVNADILLGSGKYANDIYQYLCSIGIENQHIFTGILLSRAGCKEDGLGAYDYEGGIQKFLAELKGEIYLPSVDLVLTECCTLKCRDCSNLMQYYKHPANSDRNVVLQSFRQLLSIVNYIGTVRILGGEPFVNSSLLVDVLTYFGHDSKIGQFVIVTNGTILPNEDCLTAMQCTKKIQVACSDYGFLSTRLGDMVHLLDKYEICCTVITNNKIWIDYGSVQHYEHEESIYQSLFEECTSRCYCNTLFDGKYYLCPRSAHGAKLGLIPKREPEYVDLFSAGLSEKEKKENLIDLLKRGTYVLACEYCNWKYGHPVAKAIQM